MQPRLIIALSSLRFDSHRASVDFTMLMGCFPFVSVQPFAIGGPVSQPPPHASRPLPDPVVWWSLTIIDVSRAFEGPLVNILSHWHNLSRRGLCCLHSRPGRAPSPRWIAPTGGGRTVRCLVPLRHTLFFPPQTEDSPGFSPVGTWNRRGSLPRPQCPVRPGSDRTRPVWDTTPLEAQTPPTALVRAIDKHKQPTRHTPSIFRTTGWNSRPRPKHPKEERRAKNETPSHEKR